MKNESNLDTEFALNVAKFSEILAKFNQIHSLTNYKNITEQVDDSIKPLEFLNFNNIKTAIDVGSGAGFPAIFLAMKMSECEWHLFEPNAKKSSFLSYIKVNLDLKNVIIHPQKIELCNKFHADLITSRALMKTPQLLQICTGFYNTQTKFLLYKGSSAQSEISGLNAKIFNDKNRNYILMDNLC